jgi:hypothetical protein
MKCDEFLSKVRTGGFWSRLLARLHAARCRRCAALQNGLHKMETELARTVPLTDAQRRLWEQAVQAQPMERPWSPVRLRLAAVVAAAALVAVSVVAWQWIGNSRDVQPVAEMGDRSPPDAPGLPALRQMDERLPTVQALESVDVQVVQHDPGVQVAPAQKAREPVSIPLYQKFEEYHEHPEVQFRTLRDLDEIRSGLDGLSARLDELSRKARLLNARRQVTELIDRYANLTRVRPD